MRERRDKQITKGRGIRRLVDIVMVTASASASGWGGRSGSLADQYVAPLLLALEFLVHVKLELRLKPKYSGWNGGAWKRLQLMRPRFRTPYYIGIAARGLRTT